MSKVLANGLMMQVMQPVEILHAKPSSTNITRMKLGEYWLI
jgi:hypothetical protein